MRFFRKKTKLEFILCDGSFVLCDETEKKMSDTTGTKQEFVPQFYQMDPRIEDVIPTSRHLIEGMKVLIESPHSRINTDGITGAANRGAIGYSALRSNRWCTVSDISFIGDMVNFIGTYDDGSRMTRRHHVGESWIVKADTMPEQLPLPETD